MENKRMSRFGVGPVYLALIVILTIAAYYLGRLPVFAVGMFEVMKVPLLALGLVLIVLGLVLWVFAVIALKVRRNEGNSLMTTGIFAWVRNPLYSSYTFILDGILCLQNNLFLLAFPFFYWIIFSLIVRKEETELEKIFGQEYREYKSRVNRCIPWFPRH